MGDIRPMSEAPRDGTFILAQVVASSANRWPSRWFVVRHAGALSPNDYDMGWDLFPGYGGVNDAAFQGWLPLPVIEQMTGNPAKVGV